MPASLADFTTVALDDVPLNEQWPVLARCVQALTAYYQGKISTGTEPGDALHGLYLAVDGQSTTTKDWRFYVDSSNGFVIQENTGTDVAPVWISRLELPLGGGLVSLHAATHQHGGTDEVANATPGANRIPKADSGGLLAAGWLTGVITNAEVSALAGIAYSKLNLTGSLVNADVAAAAAIALSKLAALTANRVAVTDSSGFLSTSGVTVTPTTLAFLDATSSVQTQLDAKRSVDLTDNGSFQIWSLGTNFASANDNTDISDRWYVLSDGNAAVTVAKSTTSIAANSIAAAQITQVTGNRKSLLVQIVPSHRVIPARGSVVSLQAAIARTNGTSMNRPCVALYSWDGTADAVTEDLVSAWGGSSAMFTPVANWTQIGLNNSATNFLSGDPNGVWTTLTIEGVTVPSGANNLAIVVGVDDASLTIADSWKITGVRLEKAAKASVYFLPSERAERLASIQLPQICQWLELEDFGGAGDDSTDNTPALAAAVSAMSLMGIRRIQLRAGSYRFNSKPANFTTGVEIRGCGFSQTQLRRNYSEAGGDSIGFLTWIGAGSNGGGIRDCQLLAMNGTTGGSMLAFKTNTDEPCGFHAVHNCVVTHTGTGTYAYDLYADGVSNDTSGSQGIRDLHITDSFFFKGASGTESLYLTNATNFHGTGVWCNGDITITGGGSALTNTTDAVLNVICLAEVFVSESKYVRISGIANTLIFSTNSEQCNFDGILITLTGGFDDLGTNNLIVSKETTPQRVRFFTPLAAASQGVTLPAAYTNYRIDFTLRAATDDVELFIRTDANAGASYDAGASDYAYNTTQEDTAGTVNANRSASSAQISIGSLTAGKAVGNATNEGITGSLFVHTGSASIYPMISGFGTYLDPGTVLHRWSTSAARLSAATINAIQFSFQSGNIASGSIKVYGLA